MFTETQNYASIIKMAKHKKVPTQLPLRYSLSERIGAGKDNKVFGIEMPTEVVDRLGPLVIKASNEVEKRPFTAETAQNDARFKREKYNLLTTFLGDFVPQSSFFVGSQRDADGTVRVKSYTAQRRVPQVTFDELTREQRNSDGLRGQMYGLALRLQNMHRTLNRARAIVEGQGDTFLVDSSLDLGPFSKYVQDHVGEDPSTFNYKHMVTGYKASPNLLVEPETMKLNCIDFGSGEWSDKLGAQLSLVYDIAAHDPSINDRLPTPLNDIQATH